MPTAAWLTWIPSSTRPAGRDSHRVFNRLNSAGRFVGNSVIKTNEFAPPGTAVTITTPVVVGVGHVGIAPPATAKYAPDLIGVWEVTFVVPNASSGDNPLNIGIPDPTNNNKLILNKRGSIIPIN